MGPSTEGLCPNKICERVATVRQFLCILILCSAAYAEEPAPQPSVPKRPSEPPNLSEEQREQIRQRVELHRAEAEPIFEHLLVARRARLEAVLATPTSEARIRELSTDYAKVETEMAVYISKLYNELLPLLTQEQRTWLAEHKDDVERNLEKQIASGMERLRQRQQQNP